MAYPLYTVPKMIPDIINCNLDKDYQILINFGTNIPDATGHPTTVQFPPHPTSVSALPAKSRTSEICVDVNKNANKFHISFRILTVSSCTTGQLDKLSAKATDIWTKCALCVCYFN